MLGAGSIEGVAKKLDAKKQTRCSTKKGVEARDGAEHSLTVSPLPCTPTMIYNIIKSVVSISRCTYSERTESRNSKRECARQCNKGSQP